MLMRMRLWLRLRFHILNTFPNSYVSLPILMFKWWTLSPSNIMLKLQSYDVFISCFIAIPAPFHVLFQQDIYAKSTLNLLLTGVPPPLTGTHWIWMSWQTCIGSSTISWQIISHLIRSGLRTPVILFPDQEPTREHYNHPIQSKTLTTAAPSRLECKPKTSGTVWSS